VFSFEFSLRMMLCGRRFGYLQGIVLMGKFLEFQRYSKHKNHFDISFKQTCSEKNSSDSCGQVFIVIEILYFVILVKV